LETRRRVIRVAFEISLECKASTPLTGRIRYIYKKERSRSARSNEMNQQIALRVRGNSNAHSELVIASVIFVT
jgi:hypothetical protein